MFSFFKLKITPNNFDCRIFSLGKLDAVGRKKLKMIINKWKGKSIYQVVLLDRANKLQDVVYFSLQVSLDTYYFLSQYTIYWPSHRHRTNIIIF